MAASRFVVVVRFPAVEESPVVQEQKIATLEIKLQLRRQGSFFQFLEGISLVLGQYRDG